MPHRITCSKGEEMSARSTKVTLQNKTEGLLVLNSSSLSHGEWETAPPSLITPASEASWQNDSDGFLTGDQGMAGFALVSGSASKGQVAVNWDNPYSGSNSYSVACPPGYEIEYSGGDGNNAAITVSLTISSKSKTAARVAWNGKQ